MLLLREADMEGYTIDRMEDHIILDIIIRRDHLFRLLPGFRSALYHSASGIVIIIIIMDHIIGHTIMAI